MVRSGNWVTFIGLELRDGSPAGPLAGSMGSWSSPHEGNAARRMPISSNDRKDLDMLRTSLFRRFRRQTDLAAEDLDLLPAGGSDLGQMLLETRQQPPVAR